MGLTAIFYVLAFVAGIIMTLSGRTIVGLYLYFFTLYFHAPSQWWGEGLPDLRWSLVAALVTAISLIIYPPKEKLKFWFYTENKFLSALMLLVLAQLAWVPPGTTHMEYTALLAKFLILIFLIQNMVTTEAEVKGIVYVNILGSAYLAYYGMTISESGRMEGIGNGWDSNLIGMHLAAMLFLGGYYLLEKFRWSHVIMMFGLAVVLMGLFRTESRGALLAMGLVGALCLVIRPQKGNAKFMIFVGLAALAAATLMGPQIIERFQGMKGNGEGEMQDKSAQSRIVIIKDQIDMWKDSPIVGHGHQGTTRLSPQYVDPEFQTAGGVRASHNVVMSFLVDHGVIGFVMYFSAIGIALSRITQKNAPPGVKDAPDRMFYANMLIGCCSALLCFMIGGLGADNKKLEADVWLMALIPILYYRLKALDEQSLCESYSEKAGAVTWRVCAVQNDGETVYYATESYNISGDDGIGISPAEKSATVTSPAIGHLDNVAEWVLDRHSKICRDAEMFTFECNLARDDGLVKTFVAVNSSLNT